MPSRWRGITIQEEPKQVCLDWNVHNKAETRGGVDLLDSDIEKIMEIEEDETTLLTWECDPASGGTQTPASGGTWYIRGGTTMMPGELVWLASDHMTRTVRHLQDVDFVANAELCRDRPMELE